MKASFCTVNSRDNVVYPCCTIVYVISLSLIINVSFYCLPNSEVIFVRKDLGWCMPMESTLCCEISMDAYVCTYIHTHCNILAGKELVIHKQTSINTFYVGWLYIYITENDLVSNSIQISENSLVVYWQTCGCFYWYHINDHTLHL